MWVSCMCAIYCIVCLQTRLAMRLHPQRARRAFPCLEQSAPSPAVCFLRAAWHTFRLLGSNPFLNSSHLENADAHPDTFVVIFVCDSSQCRPNHWASAPFACLAPPPATSWQLCSCAAPLPVDSCELHVCRASNQTQHNSKTGHYVWLSGLRFLSVPLNPMPRPSTCHWGSALTVLAAMAAVFLAESSQDSVMTVGQTLS